MCKRTGFEPEPRARVPRHEREAARPSASWAARSDNASGRHRGSPGHPHLIVVAYWRRASVHAEVARTSFLIYCNHAGRAKTTSMQHSEGATESSRACRTRVKIEPRSGKIPAHFQGRRGPRPLREAVDGLGARRRLPVFQRSRVARRAPAPLPANCDTWVSNTRQPVPAKTDHAERACPESIRTRTTTAAAYAFLPETISRDETHRE